MHCSVSFDLNEGALKVKGMINSDKYLEVATTVRIAKQRCRLSVGAAISTESEARLSKSTTENHDKFTDPRNFLRAHQSPKWLKTQMHKTLCFQLFVKK